MTRTPSPNRGPRIRSPYSRGQNVSIHAAKSFKSASSSLSFPVIDITRAQNVDGIDAYSVVLNRSLPGLNSFQNRVVSRVRDLDLIAPSVVVVMVDDPREGEYALVFLLREHGNVSQIVKLDADYPSWLRTLNRISIRDDGSVV